MLLLGVFFICVGLVNLSIFRMHENKAAELEKERETLTAPDEIAKNEKAHKNRLTAAKMSRISTGFMIILGAFLIFIVLM